MYCSTVEDAGHILANNPKVRVYLDTDWVDTVYKIDYITPQWWAVCAAGTMYQRSFCTSSGARVFVAEEDDKQEEIFRYVVKMQKERHDAEQKRFRNLK